MRSVPALGTWWGSLRRSCRVDADELIHGCQSHSSSLPHPVSSRLSPLWSVLHHFLPGEEEDLRSSTPQNNAECRPPPERACRFCYRVLASSSNRPPDLDLLREAAFPEAHSMFPTGNPAHPLSQSRKASDASLDFISVQTTTSTSMQAESKATKAQRSRVLPSTLEYIHTHPLFQLRLSIFRC